VDLVGGSARCFEGIKKFVTILPGGDFIANDQNSAHSGFVAVLDVLGFSSLIAGDDPRLNQYLNALQEAVGDPSASKVEYVVFSDSIVLTTGKDADSLQAYVAGKVNRSGLRRKKLKRSKHSPNCLHRGGNRTG
jgi:hypothetical protein